jgi:hypothetical protein
MGQVSTRSLIKEWPMPTFIAVQCPHCHRDQVVKRGKTACGTQRYLGLLARRLEKVYFG